MSINTTLIVDDSMLSGIEANFKKKNFINGQKGQSQTLPRSYNRWPVRLYQTTVRKIPCNKTLHVGTSNTVIEPSKLAVGKLLDLKKFIEKTLIRM